MSDRSKPRGGGRREGPDPSRYLRSRSTDTFPGQPEKVVTQQPKATSVATRARQWETRTTGAGDDDLDPTEWDIVDEVEPPKEPITEKAQRTDSTVSTDSNTALEEALSESKELRAKHEKLLRKLAEQENKSKRLQGQLAGREEEVFQLRDELAALRGPSSDLSSGNFHTPLSSLSEGAELEQPTTEGQNGGGLLMRLQTENQAKSGEITKLKQAITQLERRLDYAEDLEKQTTRLVTEASVHEQEKKELQEQVDKLQRSAKQQNPQSLVAEDVQALHLECHTLKQENADLQSQIEVTRRHEKQYSKTMDENARLRKQLAAAEKRLRSGPLTHIDDDDADEMEKLKEALQERESQLQHLQEQLELYKKTETEFSALQQHSKQQSKQAMKLRSHVDAAKVGEREHAEFEKGLMESLHSLQDQYEKLSKDYEAVSVDRGFMTESMTALKKREGELVSELQQCKAKMGQLEQQEESSRLQWEAMKDNHRALQRRNKELATEKQKLADEKQKLEVENGLFVEKMKKMSEMANENGDLQRRLIAMRKEKEDLWNELQAEKIKVFKEDFDHEREDRAKAHAQIDDIRTKLTEQLEEARRELQLHQKRLSEVEAVNQRKEGELRSALEEALASRQEVQAKASQVKQFKKQVDSLKQHVAEAEKQNTNLIQEMERVRTELLKYKGKAEKGKAEKGKAEKGKKKAVTENVPTSASSPVTPPPPGWESKVADLERENEELRNENHRLGVENEENCEEMQNLRKMNDTLKGLVDHDQQYVEHARVSSHGFSAGSRPDTMRAMVPPQPRPPPVARYDQNQELIRQQLQQGFQQNPRTEQQTAGAGALAPSGPSSLSGAMYNQVPVPRAKIQPPEPKPRVSKSSNMTPHYQQNPPVPPSSLNWPQDSRAGELRVQQPEVRALTDPQAMAHYQSAEGRFHASRSATDHSPLQNVAPQLPVPHNFQRQSSVPGPSAHGQQQQPSYVPQPNLMQHITTDIHAVAGNVISQVDEERARQPTIQHIPYDPNLVCAYCNRQFRIGEIQKYKHHVETCNGSDETGDLV